MVAGIDVAIALHDGCVTALFGIDADAWFRAHPSGEGGIEELHKNFSYIVAHPFVEDGTHEVSPLFGSDAEGSDGTVFVEELCQVSAVAMLLDAFHDGTYLQELAIQLIAEEVVEGYRVLGIEVVGGRHCVPLNMIFVEEADAVHHFLPGSLALNIATVGIVLFLCAGGIIIYSGRYSVRQMHGLGRRMPLLFGCFTLAGVSLLGVPPLPGFVSKYELVTAAFEEGSPLALAGAGALLLAAVLTAVYVFTIVYPAFFMAEDSRLQEQDVTKPGPRMTASLAVLCLLLLVLGAAAGTVVKQLYGLTGGIG